MQVRGLKPLCHRPRNSKTSFAPHAGAWIETDGLIGLLGNHKASHLMQVRGLKHQCKWCMTVVTIRTSCRCVDWNIMSGAFLPLLIGSHLMQVRGLKPTSLSFGTTSIVRTSCRCVDWNPYRFAYISTILFAPHAGAWIETYCPSRAYRGVISHLMQVRGLKPIRWGRLIVHPFRTSCRCVDWNKPCLFITSI